MASQNPSDFERTAREIVRAAMLEGTLSLLYYRELTIRKVRDRIEAMHGLEKGFLLAPQYKHSLKAVIQDASTQAKMEMKDDEARVKFRHTAAYVDQGGNDTVASKKQQAGKYKSAEFVADSSDLEELSENKPTRVSPKKSPRDRIKSKEVLVLKQPSKKRQKIVDNDNESTIQISTKAKSETKVQEMTSVFGDSPKLKSKARTSGVKSHVKTTDGNKSKGETSDKHDATIKRLKSLVYACGVRKPWAKVFKGTPKPTQQIKKLKEILTELGMTGRMTMEQAKRIKAERELAQELEDVKSFEHSTLNRSRSRIAESSPRPSFKPVESEEDEGSEDEDDIKHRRRKIPASRNIDAFIDGESIDD
ncbi:hypothetical protein J132_10362 [Termitomyces sp. J132]|nr:hypothetical protein J132_10362 [Termitomyces sp. J132]